MRLEVPGYYPNEDAAWAAADTNADGLIGAEEFRVFMRKAGFTNGEENAVSKYEVVSEPSGPGSCQDLLSERGANFSDGGVFQPNVVVDGNLLTGQNPPSAAPLADAINKMLA